MDRSRFKQSYILAWECKWQCYWLCMCFDWIMWKVSTLHQYRWQSLPIKSVDDDRDDGHVFQLTNKTLSFSNTQIQCNCDDQKTGFIDDNILMSKEHLPVKDLYFGGSSWSISWLHRGQLVALWAESLSQDCPWIKHEHLLNDSNYSSQIDHLLDKLAASKIYLEEFKRSSFYLSSEKLAPSFVGGTS